eukprot:2160491-Amphidinium_carterae.2
MKKQVTLLFTVLAWQSGIALQPQLLAWQHCTCALIYAAQLLQGERKRENNKREREIELCCMQAEQPQPSI